jgi:hypothetical protein
MKRYIVKDEEGKVVEISELEEGEKAPQKTEAPEKKDEEGATAPFTPEQMDAIRKIISEELAKASAADKPAEGDVHDEEEMKKEEEEKKEEVSDSKKAKDSKGPVSIEDKSSKVNDSSLDLEEERNNAWAKRYGISK